MNRTRKYQKTEGYWVYAHTMPDGMQYIGMSKQQPWQRWRTSSYKTTVLQQYIERFGWENITHTVLIDNLTKQQAEQWEDQIITALRMNGLCINSNRSGGIERDNRKEYGKALYEANREERLEYQKAYREAHKEEIREQHKARYEEHREEIREQQKAYYETHREEIRERMKAYDKQRLSTTECKIYKRVSKYNRYHTPIETPKEAKQKYLEFGYIPNYIKNYDLFESK